MAMSDPAKSGRLAKSVYVRRRIAVVAALVAVLVVIVMIVAGPSRVASWFGSNANVPESAAPVLPEAPGTDEGVQDGDTPEGDEAAVPGPCAAGTLAVEAVTDAVEYGADVLPELSLRVTNHSEVMCDADLGTATMNFEIKSGSEVYWSSRDCQTDMSSNLVRMAPGQTLETEPLVWDRTRSDPESCDVDGEFVPAGGSSYHLSVEIADTVSQKSKQFLLY